MSHFHPDLRIARFIPQFSFGPKISAAMRASKPRTKPAPADVSIANLEIAGPVGAPPVGVRIYRHVDVGATPVPALLWMHGGGYLFGNPEQDEAGSIAFARELGITVVALRYRTGPDNPAPAAVEDAYAALTWIAANAPELGIDPSRIAVGGASAGGGLAAALALYAHDKGETQPAFQLLIYPMLDDRTVVRTDHDTRNARVWSAKSNRLAWQSHLGQAPGSDGVSPYAAPARRVSLAGLPPAWVGVGTLDIFHDEDLLYAERLTDAGVACETLVVPGAFHGFDAVFARTPVAREFFAEQVRVLRATLLPPTAIS